jgi:hypothetical protein
MSRKNHRYVASALLAFGVVVGFVGHAGVASAGPPASQFCVGDPPGPTTSTCGFSCAAVYTTLQEALDAAAVEQAATGPKYIQICGLGTDPLDESPVIDNSAATYGSPFVLHLQGRPLCGDPLLDPDEPVLRWTQQPGDALLDLNIDLSPGGQCGTPVRRPGLNLSGPAPTFADLVRIEGTVGYGIGNGVDGVASNFTLNGHGHYIANCEGAAMVTHGEATLWNLVVAGCTVNEATGGDGLLVAVSAASKFVLHDLVFFGNLIDGRGAGPSAGILGSRLSIDNSAFIANGMAGGSPLVRAGTRLPDYSVSAWPDLTETETRWRNDVYSRNRQLQPAGSLSAPAQPVGLLAAPEGEICAGPISTAPWYSRPDPFLGVPPGTGPLLEFDGALGSQAGEAVLLLRQFFLGNDLGVGPLVRVESVRPALDVQILQSTLAANGASQLLEMPTVLADWSVVLLRNLLVDGPPPGTPLSALPGTPARAMVSMNVGPPGTDWYDAPNTSPFQIDGPQVEHTFDGTEFENPAIVRALSACDRHLMMCPDATPPSCGARAFSSRALVCGVDEAAAYIPTAAFVTELGEPWPWDTTFFEASGSGWVAPGATGWSCEAPRGTPDTITSDGAWGDGDQYPDALDCENQDAGIWPVLPPFDGFSSEYCVEEGYPCYLCPWGPNPPPGDDDDSAADDDDSSADDDDSSADDDDFTTDDDDSSADDDDFAIDDDDSQADDDDSAVDDDDSGSDDDDSTVDDDDSSSASPNDDDSGGAPDDDDSAATPSLPPPDGLDSSAEEGCSQGGCAYSWNCAEGETASVALVSLLALGWRRRRD